MQGRYERAEETLKALHKDPADPDDTYAHNEMILMRRQIDYEQSRKTSLLQALRKPSLRLRFIVGFLVMSGTQCSGLIVVLSTSSLPLDYYTKS
jgi:hypothetical protein